MIKDIVKDQFFLSRKSEPATLNDAYIIDDLLDTLTFHKERCVGIAANMLGYLKTMMVVNDHGKYVILINPVILKAEGIYKTHEGCLSHVGEREVSRYRKIKVEYLDEKYKKKIKTYEGYTAQIIQHELDHFEGKLI